jgi:hypothetical protein
MSKHDGHRAHVTARTMSPEEETRLIEEWADMTVAERKRALPTLTPQQRRVVSEGCSDA